MLKRIVSEIMLSLLLIGMFTLTLHVQPVRAEPKTWTVDDDGSADFSKIQDAIDTANPGDTIYVRTGTYRENLGIAKAVQLIGEDRSTTIIDGMGKLNVILVAADDVTITGFTVMNSSADYIACGICIHSSEPHARRCTITQNCITNNRRGVFLWKSSNNIISGNKIVNNVHGIWAVHESSNNSVSKNTIAYNERGIWLEDLSSNNNIEGNNITANNWQGIRLQYGSSNNLIYHNNFVNNTQQVDSDLSTNVWDIGYPSGGNYWSHYTGVDLYGGPYQNETGSDGIGDIPYYIDTDNIDHYPLMSPWTEVHDIAIASVMSSATEVYVGRIVNITVMVQNEGTFTGAFNVTCKYELEGTEHVIDTMTVDALAPQANTSIVFTWTTTDITVHTISANATILPSETDTTDNTLISPTPVKVKILGDVNNDDTVNILDLVVAANAFGAVPSSWAWNPQADIYPDGKIDIFDLVMIVLRFGKTA